jgi:hypothetical protein
MQDGSWVRAPASPPALLWEPEGRCAAEFEKKSMEDMQKLRHYKKTMKRKEAARKAAVLEKAVALNRQRLLEQAEGAVAMRKKLDDAMIARRVVVFETLAGAGIPLAKLDDPPVSVWRVTVRALAAARVWSKCRRLCSNASSMLFAKRSTHG